MCARVCTRACVRVWPQAVCTACRPFGLPPPPTPHPLARYPTLALTFLPAHISPRPRSAHDRTHTLPHTRACAIGPRTPMHRPPPPPPPSDLCPRPLPPHPGCTLPPAAPRPPPPAAPGRCPQRLRGAAAAHGRPARTPAGLAGPADHQPPHQPGAVRPAAAGLATRVAPARRVLWVGGWGGCMTSSCPSPCRTCTCAERNPPSHPLPAPAPAPAPAPPLGAGVQAPHPAVHL